MLLEATRVVMSEKWRMMAKGRATGDASPRNQSSAEQPFERRGCSRINQREACVPARQTS